MREGRKSMQSTKEMLKVLREPEAAPAPGSQEVRPGSLPPGPEVQQGPFTPLKTCDQKTCHLVASSWV